MRTREGNRRTGGGEEGGGKGTDGSVLGNVDALVHRERPEAVSSSLFLSLPLSSSLFLSRVRSWSSAAAHPFSEGLSANICTQTSQKNKINTQKKKSQKMRGTRHGPRHTAHSDTNLMLFAIKS